MKNQITLAVITTLLSISAYCQNNDETRLIDGFEIASMGKLTRKVPPKTQGSPYLIKMFAPAKVGNVTKIAPLRYDVYNDEFEFIDAKKDTLVLNKTEAFSNIIFTYTNVKYQLVDYTNKKGDPTTGYLISLHENKGYILYKKQTITFSKEQVAERPFEPSSPARFEPGKDIFYFKNNDKGIVLFPSSKKALLKFYPEKKAEIEVFIKQNDIDFDKETDMAKIIDFLAIQNL